MSYGTLREEDASLNSTLEGESGCEVCSRDSSPTIFDNGEREQCSSGEDMPLLKGVVIIASLSGVSFASSISSGLLTVGLPTMAESLKLPDYLLVWPYTVYSLATCCCLLLSGTIADLVGDRIVNLIGTLFVACSILASGLATDGIQLILFRGVQGVGISMCLPTAVSITTRSFSKGQRRTFGFSCLGLVQPLGYSLGLVGGGFLETSAERWRDGWYTTAGIVFLFLLGNFWSLPKDIVRDTLSWRSLKTEIDWIGVSIASISLGSLSYVAAILNENPGNIKQYQNIVLLAIALLFAPMFPLWMTSQTRNKRPALIPNALWRNKAFSVICLMVFTAWAAVQGTEVFLSLFYQKVQGLPAIQASIRLLPNILSGIILTPLVGLFIQHVSPYYVLVVSSVVSVFSPFVMTIINPEWSYWSSSLWAVALSPVSVDVIFTIAHLIITDVFPANTHALAGAVFNTVAQLGTSVGLSIMAMASHYITETSRSEDRDGPDVLMIGYRGAFGVALLMMIISSVAAMTGLQGLERLGGKAEEDFSQDEAEYQSLVRGRYEVDREQRAS